MRFRSDSCTAASGPGQAGRLELRVENEQEIGLGKVIHSITQITHTFSGDAEGTFPQLVHSPGADRSSAGGPKRGETCEERCTGGSPQLPKPEGQIFHSGVDLRS